ncbi:glycosyltransferase family 4 protein [Comamonas endophytica]|uniref:glycosyltransferase family 4 protein n=1 Tax=Comamonas endophytica TaxID=2949090 RepID=UPI003620D86C
MARGEDHRRAAGGVAALRAGRSRSDRSLPGAARIAVQALRAVRLHARAAQEDRQPAAGLRMPAGRGARAIPLVLVGGTGWLSDDLHATIERLAAQGWLRYLGFVPEADLPALYAGAQAFVYPSIYEGFGLPVLEAMASGVPVVTSIFTSLPEVTQGAARLVDPDDIDALALGIHTALCDEAWRATACETGLEKARNFTWSRCVEQTIDVYRQVAARNG